MFCSKCGKENNENVQVCIFCNTILQTSLPSGPLQPDSVLKKRYKICEAVKKGGMGAVYKARDMNLNCTCAVKELLPAPFDKPEKQKKSQEWFEREAKILAKLDHPNLPAVTDYFVENNRYYLVMNFIEGKDLDTLLKEKGKTGLPEGEVIDLGKEILKILVYLHNQKPPVIYRDIKPANIMLHKDGRPMLIDFGIARKIQPSSHTQKTAIGTPGYAPEEQCYGRVETRSDIYALGATMHHLLTGIIPEPFVFKFKPLRQIRPEISIKTEKIVMKALEEKVSRRFAGAKEMLSAMNSAGTGEVSLTKQRKVFIALVSILVFAIPAILYCLRYFSVEEKNSGWQIMDSGTFEDLEAIFFLDPEHGWAVGLEGTILGTKAGIRGKLVWEVLDSNTGEDLYDIYFFDPLNGLVTGEGGILLYTRDGGKTWDREFIKSPDGITHCFVNIKFFDPLNGWISGSTLLHTENGGKTWEDVDGISDLSFMDFHFIDPFRGWITGLEGSQENITAGIILHTDNGGKNWSRLTEEELYNIEPSKIYFTDESNGWITGSERTGNDLSGIILKTDDGGKAWYRETPVFPVYHYNEIYFTDALTGWAVGMEGVNQQPSGIIIRTGDGGKTWIEENIPADRIIKDIHFINNNCGWAAGEKGTILYYSE